VIRLNNRATEKRDEITEAVGVKWFIKNYYDLGLRKKVFGPYSRDLIGVTRFYPKAGKLRRGVVVDFHPPPRGGQFYGEQKAEWFMRQGIVYVPIYLNEVLTMEEFETRLKLQEARTSAASREHQDNEALASVPLSGATILQDEKVVAWINREANRRIDSEIASGKHLYGYARTLRLKAYKKTIAEELVGGNVQLGQLRRTHEFTQPAG